MAMVNSRRRWMNVSFEKKKKFVECLIERDGGSCWLCGLPVKFDDPIHPFYRTVDHVMPLWFGGDCMDLDNMRLAHACCNHERNREDEIAIRKSFVSLRDFVNRVIERADTI